MNIQICSRCNIVYTKKWSCFPQDISNEIFGKEFNCFKFKTLFCFYNFKVVASTVILNVFLIAD